MKQTYLRSALAVFIYSALTLPTALADEAPSATDLVGKTYGGFHALHIETDDERLATSDPSSALDNGNGLGVEIGYRWLPSTEFRLSYSKFDLNTEKSGFNVDDGASTSVEMLFFPTEKNFYLLAGVNNLDIVSSQTSGTFGAGYRHYFNERSAIYFESKANYQFSERFDDLTAQVGFVYFFGDVAKTKTSASKPIPKPQDTDKDGVYDQNDNCPNSPMVDKVDVKGCTVFIDRETSIQLLVEFDHNESIIKEKFTYEIKAMADFLTENPYTSITIEGHSSSPGSSAYNQRLSHKRANGIINKLINDYNIDASRLSSIGYGEERLLNSANTEAAHAQNRRIMAKVKVTKKVAVKRM
jgi:OOP family OmpA-OmpF porin